MPVDSSLAEHLIETLSALGAITVRRMFGGAGVYCDGLMLGLIAYDVLYFKVDDQIRGDYVAEGMGPFVYEGKGKPIEMSYWRVPDRLFDESDEMVAWAAKSLAVARRAANAKSARSSRAGPGTKTPTTSTQKRRTAGKGSKR